MPEENFESANAPGPRRDGTNQVSLRLDNEMLDRIKEVAGRKGRRYQSLIKDFIGERLYEEEVREEIVVPMRGGVPWLEEEDTTSPSRESAGNGVGDQGWEAALLKNLELLPHLGTETPTGRKYSRHTMNFSRRVTLALVWEATRDYGEDRSKLTETEIERIIDELSKMNKYVRRFNEEEWNPDSPRYKHTSRSQFWDEWRRLVQDDVFVHTEDDRGGCIREAIRQTLLDAGAELRYVKDPRPEVRVEVQ